MQFVVLACSYGVCIHAVSHVPFAFVQCVRACSHTVLVHAVTQYACMYVTKLFTINKVHQNDDGACEYSTDCLQNATVSTVLTALRLFLLRFVFEIELAYR